ncbi:MAG: hypothetical protein GDA49_05560 [Rhodospirillales bacterium]|nr:hypothetical protein [Rhodospirillales bacterium]
MNQLIRSGETEAVVIIKAAPRVGQKHGETVCCAVIDLHGRWLRLYPISFRSLDETQKFRRWQRIRFKCRRASDDPRIESHRVDQGSIKIVGSLKKSERRTFLASSIVSGLDSERSKGRSLALLKAEIIGFRIEKKTTKEVKNENEKFEALRRQAELFNTTPIIPYEPCPYRFKYKYRTDDGEREGTCQDWETEATYYRWAKEYGGEEALAKIQRVYGEDYPKKGMLFAMGTHSLYPDTWLINGVVRLDGVDEPTLF